MSKYFRVKCSSCGEVCNALENAPCPKCGKPIEIPTEGMIQIYRMGHPVGVATGYGIYMNSVPMGYIANKESIRIPVKYGQYKLHMTCGMTRRCNDVLVTVSPEWPKVYLKARIKPGFWRNTILIEQANPEDMPPL